MVYLYDISLQYLYCTVSTVLYLLYCVFTVSLLYCIFTVLYLYCIFYYVFTICLLCIYCTISFTVSLYYVFIVYVGK